MLRIIFIGIAVCLLNIFLKKQLSEFVLPVEIIFITLAVFLATEYLQKIFADLSDIISQVQYGEEVFTAAVKGTGICLVTRFSSDICCENGNKAVADVIEFTGRIMLVIIAVPYIESIMNIAFAFLK